MSPLGALVEKIIQPQLRRWQAIALVALVAAIGMFPPGPQPPRLQEEQGLAAVQPRDRERQTARIESKFEHKRNRATDVRRRAIAPSSGPAERSKDLPATSTATPPAKALAPATIVAKALLPRLKPRAADRRNEIIALLKRGIAKTPGRAPAVTAAIPPKPMLKPQEFAGRPHGVTNLERSPASAGHRRVRAAAPDLVPLVEDLERQLAVRDAMIADLMGRVEQLEQRTVLSAAQLDQAVAGQAGPRGGPAADAGAAEAPVEKGAADDQADVGEQAPPAPGQFEVDEESVERALERTLVQEGVLLVPYGQGEIEPSFSYTRQEGDAPTFVTENGDTFVGEQKVRRNTFQSVTAMRFGLPFDAQFEISMPYEYVDQSTMTTVGDVPMEHRDRSGTGFGDLRVGAAKTLIRENGGWWPDVIGRFYWDTDTGKTQNNGVFLGGGFHEVGGGVSFVKRQDPLAFTGGISYQKGFKHDDIEPGDELGFSLGTFLAASPETSLRLGLNQTFVDNFKVDGKTIDGSDQVMATLTIGAAMILGRNVLLDISGEVGLTDDAPDYAVGASMPIRFDFPIY